MLLTQQQLRTPAELPVSMTSVEEQEQKICEEFANLLEQSRIMFSYIRDLPKCGQRIWHGLFWKTFDTFTKLWKFQQQHRGILDKRYGLKRWQIGEIANKIGQLYFHYYLRTSEVKNLYLSFSFYQAIRTRQYYSKASLEESSEIMIKKLRYYARFIVVCMLMKDIKLVSELLDELDRHIVDYNSVYVPDNQMEWSTVMREIRTFLQADNVVNIVDSDQNTVTLCHRLTPNGIPPVERSSLMTLTLQQTIVIGNVTDQAKYSEMTIDMLRMIQTLERDRRHEYCNDATLSNPRGLFEKVSSFSSTKDYSGMPPPYNMECPSRSSRRENPHKYCLYKPGITQVMMFLATGFKELANDGALLMYISADGCFSSSKQTDDLSYDRGGVVTSGSSKETGMLHRENIHIRESHCLYPGDLHPFTRKPLFIIVDSDNSNAFQYTRHFFGHPFVVLMSPQVIPDAFYGYHRNGNIFTLFLHSPLTAFCLICNIRSLHIHHWQKCETYVNKFVAEASQLFTRSSVDDSYLQFFGDDFLRLLLLRYVFCSIVLRNHESFRQEKYLPKSYPPLPENELFANRSLFQIILELANNLEVKHQFTTSHMAENNSSNEVQQLIA